MRFLSSVLVLSLGLFAGSAHAIFPQDSTNQALLARANKSAPLEGIGDVINRTKSMLRYTYDFSVLATSGSVYLVDDQGNQVSLPKGAIVTNVVMNVLTQPLPSTTSVSLGLLTSTDLMAQKAQSAVTGFVAGAPVGTAATWVGPVVQQSGWLANPVITLTGSTLTAGKIEFFLEYVIQ